MKTIVVVEDDLDIYDMYQRNLNKCGYQILGAGNGKEGLELAISKLPDLIITDKNMPIMNGYEMTRKLKAEPKTSQIPIIGCGDFSEEEQSTLDYYVEKSVVQQLYTKVEELLGKS